MPTVFTRAYVLSIVKATPIEYNVHSSTVVLYAASDAASRASKLNPMLFDKWVGGVGSAREKLNALL